MNLEAQLEGILFYRAEPMTIAELARALEASEEAVVNALGLLEKSLTARGICLVHRDDMYELLTAPDLSRTIETLRKEELKRDIGKAGAETLAIILYNDQVTRAEIDFIRGVNSSFIVRNLLIRGLIERAQNPKDQRSFVYKPTLELYAHLGITKKEELPHYQDILGAVAQYRTEQKHEVNIEAT